MDANNTSDAAAASTSYSMQNDAASSSSSSSFSSAAPPPSPSPSSLQSSFSSLTTRRVLMGTAGWTDSSLLRCGRFYSSHVRSATDRLRYYCTHFPCVEVDTSNYAIPSANQIEGWRVMTPPTFIFHFKVFGLFTNQSCELTALPSSLRPLLSPRLQQRQGKVRLRETSDEFQSALWKYWNDTLLPLHQSGQLGVVIFQFPLSFTRSESNKGHVRWCRSMLDARYTMGVEFRCREWQGGRTSEEKSKGVDKSEEDIVNETVLFLRSLDCILIGEDDLEHEVLSRTTPLTIGQDPIHLPIVIRVASPRGVYIRMHRRQGDKRVLSDDEFDSYAERFSSLLRSEEGKSLRGPVWWIIGTDHEDQPIINSNKMQSTLEKWDQTQKEKYEHEKKEREQTMNVNAAASSSSSSSSTTPLSSPPDPLSFDYRLYYKSVLSRLPPSSSSAFYALQPSSQQQSIQHFFTAAADSKGKGKEKGEQERKVEQENKQADAAVTALNPTAASSPSSSFSPSASSSSSPVKSSSPFRSPASPSSNFISASSLLHSSSSAKANFISSILSSPSSSSSSSSASAAAPLSDDRIAAEVAAIDRIYAEEEQKRAMNDHSSAAAAASSSSTSSPASSSPVANNKRPAAMLSPPASSSSASKKTKSSPPANIKGVRSLHAFFSKQTSNNNDSDKTKQQQ